MDKAALAIHIIICLIIGGLISYFTDAKWLAASFWVSAGLYINGAIATYEDFRPGGFENPDGTDTPNFVVGFGATKFALKSLLVTIGLAVFGTLIQGLV